MTLTKRVWQDEQAFVELAPAWEALLQQSAFPSPFMSPIWHQVWWQHFSEGALHIVAWYENNTLVGLAPFHLADGHFQCCLRPVGGTEIADYLDILAPKGRELPIYRALVEHLASPDAPLWQDITLINLPEATPTHRELPHLAQGAGWWAWVDVEDVCPIIPLPKTFEEYLQMLKKKQRHEVRRKLRRLYKEATTVHHWTVRSADELPEAMDMFLALHRRSSPEKAAFMTAQMEGFFRHIAAVALERGWLRLSFLIVDGTPLATLFSFDYNGRRMVYNSGFDPEAARELSPGWNLVVLEIKDAIERGLKVFDFLQGDEEYKFRLGGQPTYVYRLSIRRHPPHVTTETLAEKADIRS